MYILLKTFQGCKHIMTKHSSLSYSVVFFDILFLFLLSFSQRLVSSRCKFSIDFIAAGANWWV